MMANQTPAEYSAREAPQLEDLSLGLGVSAFRPGRTIRRSDLHPPLLQPTVEQKAWLRSSICHSLETESGSAYSNYIPVASRTKYNALYA